jgi:phenylpropionate dioxygenase-like ring-hydroxylating dioxygenase large terminal subunit
MALRQRTLQKAYAGYHKQIAVPDAELTSVGPDTPGGEYLRRFWHPIEVAADLGDRPKAIRILGEDLVLFRNLSGELGLLHRHCPHRGASLEFGRITAQGIQCCYHGWHFAPTGALLETPVDPTAGMAGRLFQGAYPVAERAGLIFAYMGPPDLAPQLPNFDFFTDQVEGRVLYKRHSPCNWIQTRDNEVDNAHGYFLHTVMAGVQLTTAHQELAQMRFVESPNGILTTQSRRVGPNVFVRINSLVMPNMSRIACIEDGQGTMIFDRRGPIVHWSVPVDDENTFVIGFNTVAKDLPNPELNTFMDRAVTRGEDPFTHPQLNFVFGQDGSRPYEERQQIPGDWDAWVSQGRIHATEQDHLVPNDRGVAMFHRMLREGIRDVADGKKPKGSESFDDKIIETYSSNTSVPIAPGKNRKEDDEQIAALERLLVAQTLYGSYKNGLLLDSKISIPA